MVMLNAALAVHSRWGTLWLHTGRLPAEIPFDRNHESQPSGDQRKNGGWLKKKEIEGPKQRFSPLLSVSRTEEREAPSNLNL